MTVSNSIRPFVTTTATGKPGGSRRMTLKLKAKLLAAAIAAAPLVALPTATALNDPVPKRKPRLT